jgi:hypothetical protein
MSDNCGPMCLPLNFSPFYSPFPCVWEQYIYIYIYSLIKYSIISFKFNGIQKTIEIKHLLVFINTTITFSVCALKNNDYLTYRNNKTKRSLHKSSNV